MNPEASAGWPSGRAASAGDGDQSILLRKLVMELALPATGVRAAELAPGVTRPGMVGVGVPTLDECLPSSVGGGISAAAVASAEPFELGGRLAIDQSQPPR